LLIFLSCVPDGVLGKSHGLHTKLVSFIMYCGAAACVLITISHVLFGAFEKGEDAKLFGFMLWCFGVVLTPLVCKGLWLLTYWIVLITYDILVLCISIEHEKGFVRGPTWKKKFKVLVHFKNVY